MSALTIIPAYGRDYTSAIDAINDWVAGKDFRIADISCRWDGSYVDISQTDALLADGCTALRFRFNQLRDVTEIPL
jgi:hypothetical protein